MRIVGFHRYGPRSPYSWLPGRELADERRVARVPKSL